VPLLTDLLHAIVLGLVEGATEFIPVSSTGHLILATSALGLDPEASRMVVFNIVIQLAAILAVVWAYRERIVSLLRRLPHDSYARRFVTSVVIASIPAAGLGFAIEDWMDENLFNPLVVALALVLGGFAILIIERFAARRPARVMEMEDVAAADALKVGLAQCLSLIPGVSRSGATILGGVAFGLSRKAAAEFSFFLAIPIMIGASGLKLVKDGGSLSGADIPFFAVGCVVAFLSALIVVRFLIRFVAGHTFVPFAWYRIGFGLVVLGWYLL
jgi:undecaprenyl-diphosphatase